MNLYSRTNMGQSPENSSSVGMDVDYNKFCSGGNDKGHKNPGVVFCKNSVYFNPSLSQMYVNCWSYDVFGKANGINGRCYNNWWQACLDYIKQVDDIEKLRKAGEEANKRARGRFIARQQAAPSITSSRRQLARNRIVSSYNRK